MMEVSNGTPTGSAQNGTEQDSGEYKLKFCTVCASNQNRSASPNQPTNLA